MYSQAIGALSFQFGAALGSAYTGNTFAYRLHHLSMAIFIGEVLKMSPRWWSLRDLKNWLRYRRLKPFANSYIVAASQLGAAGELPAGVFQRVNGLYLRLLLEWGRMELRL